MKKLLLSSLLAMIAALLVVSSTDAQMEKRIDALFRQKAFVATTPKIGELSPELNLKTLDGDDAVLSSYLGKPLVIIKGSYT
ncbi:MAG: hypothetical protein AAFN77_13590 [Planctomycetota bacterium]